MRLVDAISNTINMQITHIDHTIKKIAGNPSTTKKVLQIAGKTFAAIDLYFIGTIQKRDLTDVMKGTVELIEFYGTYKNMMYWVNLFSKESLDEKKLKKSIKSSLCDPYTNSQDIKKQKKIATKVFQDVMAQKEYRSKGEVFDALKISLAKHGYTDKKKINAIANRVNVQQKGRPLVQLMYMACFTMADLVGNILTLKKWNIVDLSFIAVSIGGQSRVLMFVVNLGVDTVLGTVASAGLVLVVGEASYRAITSGIKLYRASTNPLFVSPQEKEKAYQELRNALLDLLSGGTDLIYVSAPLLFALNPPAVIALALVAKGTGLICILIR